MVHKAGFVNIIGKPNVGKSTLINALIGEKLSITTSKAQTTRHRILGIANGENYQVVFSDTPGIMEPKNKLHDSMMQAVDSSFKDADIILLITDIYDKEEDRLQVIGHLKKAKIPIFVVINKIDQSSNERLDILTEKWKQETLVNISEIIKISALKGENVNLLKEKILEKLPESPPYYPKDELSDRPEKFFVQENIREKIFNLYREEIPYSTEVNITAFKEQEHITKISADIVVNKASHKPIIIGKGGSSLKQLGTLARIDIEAFLQKKVYLELHVKIRENWRDNPTYLRSYGY